MEKPQGLQFVVGEEKRLADVLGEAEVLPLLRSVVRAGVEAIAVFDERQVPLWSCGGAEAFSPLRQGHLPLERGELFLEGEPVGSVAALGQEGVAPIAVRIVAGALNGILTANLKRMLTTEIHTQVINQSYDELVETNRRLTQSEQKYRDLAESLEIRVQERTEELKRLYAKMLAQEKMASVGQLAAGVAHEINNPLGFIASNLGTLEKYVGRFTEMLTFCREAGKGERELESRWQALKLDFVLEDVPELLQQSRTGAERVKKIVADLKGFSHVDDAQVGPVAISEELERTLNVLSHEIPPGAVIRREFSLLPPVLASPALLCQAFVNILRNAFQARPQGLELTVRTEATPGEVRVIFADNGPGIAPEIRHRIFEPFFTTREVGQGMGMGLTVAWDIVSGCGGSIEVAGEPGQGAVFTLRLPLRGGHG